MYMVKGGEKRANTFGEGWGTFPPTSPPPNAGFGGVWAAAAGGDALGGGLVGSGAGKEREGGGEETGAGPGHWPCRASPHGATGLSRQCMRRDRLSHVSASVAERCLGRPACQPCRATCSGATEATCRARTSGATKQATPFN